MKWGFLQPWKSLRVLKSLTTDSDEDGLPWNNNAKQSLTNDPSSCTSPPDLIHHQFKQSESDPIKLNGWLTANLTTVSMEHVTIVPEEHKTIPAILTEGTTDLEVHVERRFQDTTDLEVHGESRFEDTTD